MTANRTSETVLSVRSLSAVYPGEVRALSDVSFDLTAGQCLAIMGESGSGKSTLARALLGLSDPATMSGALSVVGRDMSSSTEEDWRIVRATKIAIAFQSTSALNPTMSIAQLIHEPLRVHTTANPALSRERARELMESVGLGEEFLDRFPSQLSGGQRRLVAIAVALACDPDVLVLDEPTAGLDPIARDRVIRLLHSLRAQRSTAIVAMTHDLDLARRISDDLLVLYAGWMAEYGPTAPTCDEPLNPYTFGLLGAVPTLTSVKELRGIRPAPPDSPVSTGCPFAPRCTQPVDACWTTTPVLEAVPSSPLRRVACLRGGIVTLLAASNLAKDYKLGDGLSRRRIRALDDVSITVRHGEVLGIVGTNGAGKSTLGLCLAGLIEPDDGKVSFDGEDISTLDRPATRALRRRLQLVQQDPFESLSPHFNVSEQLLEPLQIQGIEASPDRLNTALRQMRLPTTAEFLGRRMHELSGGQLQRLSIARALVLDPELLILDEPVSMLDPSEQAEVLSLLKAAQVARGMSMIVVGHDIAVIMRLADRIAVLHGGRIVDEEPGERLISRAKSSATHRLLAAAGVTQFAQTPVTGEEKTTL